MEDLPEGLFRNAIDLNRFSNGTSHKLINSYNRIILKAVAELKRIEAMPSAKRPKVRAARLRALLAQTKESLKTWSVKSVNELAKDLEGIAQIQSDFATQQISKALSPSARQLLSVKSVEVTPSFANAVVNADPLDISARVLGQSLEDAVKGASGSFKLTATQGSQVRMPGGQSITKLFRGLAEKNAELFATNVQDGLLTGETTQQIARQLVGNLEFGDIGPLTKGQIRAAKLSVKEIMAKGGSLTKMANHQVMTLTRTSINQVANKASQQVYKANSDLTSKYRYVATLDSKTSPICRELDGQEFVYGKGPEPAQHFNCRSTTVAVIDYDKIQEKHPNVKPPSKPLGKRAAAGGSVPSNTTYGKWLQKQPASVKSKTLGKEKAKYFDRLAKKYGPDEAMKKFVRDDGSEVSLKTFKARYGKPEDIKIKPPVKPKPKPKPKTQKTNLDPDVLLRKARSNPKAYLGGGAFGNAYSVDGDPPLVIKGGRFGRHEVDAMEKLKGTGVAPEVKAKKYTTGWTKDHEFGISSLEVREGTVVMTRAKGKPVATFLDDKKKFGTVSSPKNLKQREDMINEYIKTRKVLHKKGISHNDMHDENFFFDVKTNKGSVVDFGLAKMDPRSALVEALGPGTGGDDQAQRMMTLLKGKGGSSPALLKKLENNIFHVQNELDKRGLDDLARNILDWDTFTDPKKLVHPDLTDELAIDIIDMVYEGI
jgi:SPP1 gp7 family putative phage head morphogenesis protein